MGNPVEFSLEGKVPGSKANVELSKSSITFHYPCQLSYVCEPYQVKLKAGYYKFEAWGAGTPFTNGAYTSGVIGLKIATDFLIYIGGIHSGTHGGYNGGGNAPDGISFPGSGATDIRLDESLHSRIMVAAGSGGKDNDGYGAAGEEEGLKCTASRCGYGGTQTAGGSGNPSGTFGQGGSSTDVDGGGGGGGYWGGGHGLPDFGGGGGGSSFVSGHPRCIAIKSSKSTEPSNSPIHYSGLFFDSPLMLNGASNIPSPHNSTSFLPVSDSNYGVFKITTIGLHVSNKCGEAIPIKLLIAALVCAVG